MDWFLHGMARGQHGTADISDNKNTPAAAVPIPSMVPQLQGDPTFLYGGYGYRPPTFGYAWSGASQGTSFAQLPTDSTSSSKAVTSPKASLAKSVSAPDLQNPAAMRELQKKAQQQSQQQHLSKLPQGTPLPPRHKKHLTMGHAPPGTPGESAANTPSSSRASTPPRRGGMTDSFYIGMAAA